MTAGTPMRSALMLTPDVGRLDRRIAQEAASLAASGWRVDIYSAVDPNLSYDDTLPNHVRLLRRPTRGKSRSTAMSVLRKVKRASARVLPALNGLSERARYGLTDPASNLVTLADDISSLGTYALIICHDIPVVRLGLELRRRLGAVVLTDLHEIYPEQTEFLLTEASRDYWRVIEGEAIQASDGIICVNQGVADYVSRSYRFAPRTIVVRNSVPYVNPSELRGDDIRSIYGIPTETRVMLYAGSLRPNKGLEQLVEGFARAGLTGWALATLGDGAAADDLKRLAGKLYGTMIFLGRRVPQRSLLGVAASANVGVLPYAGIGLNHELATPNKLFEYAAARLPVATSPLPEVRRILAGSHTSGEIDFTTAETTADGLRSFVFEALPQISSADLEEAANRLAWSFDEAVMLSLVESIVVPDEPSPSAT